MRASIVVFKNKTVFCVPMATVPVSLVIDMTLDLYTSRALGGNVGYSMPPSRTSGKCHIYIYIYFHPPTGKNSEITRVGRTRSGTV